MDFPLAVGLVLRSCAVNYLNQTWLEAMDYLMNGVLGDGPWCPWLLDAEVNLRARVSRYVFSFVFCVYSLRARRVAPLNVGMNVLRCHTKQQVRVNRDVMWRGGNGPRDTQMIIPLPQLRNRRVKNPVSPLRVCI